MPRGIPNNKREDAQGMRYTTFHVPLALTSVGDAKAERNPKHSTSAYLKSESQTLWARNAARQKDEVTFVSPENQSRRGSHTIVVHPGSRFLRIGRATDLAPVTVPNVIARKTKPPVPPPVFVEGITRPRKNRSKPAPPSNADEYAVIPASDDPYDEKVSIIQTSLRDRMRFYKFRVTPDAAHKASMFNEQFQPEIIAEENDPFRIPWIQEPLDDPYLVGEKALILADPVNLGYVLRWPICGGKFNTRDYPSNQMIMDDIEAIIQTTLKEKFGIEPSAYNDHSVILIIPDFYDRPYLHDMADLFLKTMGFKQLCAQQEALAATYGSGITAACVVNMGAQMTNIACVDEGMVLPDTRMYLNMGGDHVTEFLYTLLQKINIPYRDINLARSYDWMVMEDLKARLCTLSEGDVALNLYDFVVRRPGKPTEKYGLRAYDEVILAPMCLFEPRVVDFDRRRIGMRPIQHPDVSDEISYHREHRDFHAEQYTQAMVISTQHLFTVAEIPPVIDLTDDGPIQPDGDSLPPPSDTQEEEVSATGIPMDIDVEGDVKPVDPSASTSTSTPTPAPVPAPVLLGDPGYVEPPQAPPGVYNQPRADIDIAFEASKLPLDVAIFNSTRAAGGNDKIKKYLQNVLLVGGTALLPGMAHALQSRLQAIAIPLLPMIEKVIMAAGPKDVDLRELVWKGGSALGKMEGVSDLWVTSRDWDLLGMRGLRERCFFL
ncbi:actin-related protein [Amylostereum chailletii]|nr:actin-related protein [Amylostereum chailletii]